MRSIAVCLLLSLAPVSAQSSDEKDAVTAVQKLFDAMAAHDGAAIRALMTPDARLYSVRDNGAPASRTGDDFATQLGSMKGDIVERFTSTPAVSFRGRMAQVWGEYEFLRDGKFSHCGVDSVSLFKTPDGWKVAAIAYTAETTGCKGR